MLPESPRYLISKDRREEAFDILVKYHAEGDRDSIFVKAEMAQIETTIKLELEVAKQSWFDMIKTAGMRRRTALAAAMGFFTQVRIRCSELHQLAPCVTSDTDNEIHSGLEIPCYPSISARFLL